MSTTTRGRGRGGGRGNNRGNSRAPVPNGAPTGPSNTGARRGFSGATVPGLTQSKAGFGAPRRNPTSKSAQKRATDGGAMSGGALADRYNELKRSRETERADAEKRGIVAIPGKARKLADAITPVGTCPDMCPEFERVERAVQNAVWGEEKDPDHSAYAPGEALPIETRMVKTFKRSDAGKGEQLPSDLRPPAVLKQTCDYLFNDLLANATSLGQVTKVEDVRLAVECYERMARFHIASLHHCATAEPYEGYSAPQEREQLDKTLLSLMQYYDDNRHRLELPNEPEFRAYCILFQLRAPEPNLEDRVQSWPRNLAQDPRVQIALKLYAAACSTERRGPFKNYPTAPVIARQDWELFWKLIGSSQVSFLMACVAEMHFGSVRDMVLKSIVRTSRVGKTVNGKTSGSTDWTMEELWDLFNFDEEDQLVAFCEQYGLQFQNREDDGKAYLELGSVAGKSLQSPTTPPTQLKTNLVDDKRHRRMLPAIIDGLSVRQAQAAGLVQNGGDDGDEMGGMTDYSGNGNEEEEDDADSLFVPEARKQNTETRPTHGFSSGTFGKTSFATNPTTTSTFGQPSGSNGVTSTFGKPSNGAPFGKPNELAPTVQPTPAFNFNPQKSAAEVKPAPFSFTQQKPAAEEKAITFSFLNAGASKPAPSPAVDFSAFGKSSAPATNTGGSSTSGGFSSTAAGKEVAPSNPFSFAKPATSTSPSLFPSKPADGNAALSNPFKPQNSGSLSGPSTTTTAPGPNFAPFSAPTAPPTAPSTFGGQQAFAPSNSATSETKPNSAASQSHFTAPSASSPPPSNNTSSGQEASSNNSGAGSRRPSVASVLDTKPKKPSPLSNSFTSFDDGGSSARAPLNGFGASTEGPQELFSDKQRTHFTPALPTTNSTSAPEHPQTQAWDSDAILTRLAHELTHDPVVGFLKQYVEYHVKSVITKTQERLYRERVNKEADDFRTWFLQDKFGKRWRETCRRQRLAKQGRERRKRAQRRLHESQRSDTLGAGSVTDTASVLTSSVTSCPGVRKRSKREMVDAMYQSTLGGSLIQSDRQAQAGGTRHAASVVSDASSTARASGHKKSAGHVDDHGRVSKPNASSDANADILKRSSFLKFSLSSDAPNRGSTTRTSYFRMKALAVKSNLDTDLSRGVKRQREDSIGSSGATPPPRMRPSPPTFSAHKSIELGHMAPPSRRSTRSQASDDDDALFARLKAARESLKESGTFMRSEVQKEKESDLKRSVGSGSDSESPSLLRARAEARARAYQADSDFGASISGRDVPAYRSRQSRFVPREHYARAIERANDLRASRSTEMSRSASDAGQYPIASPTHSTIANQPYPQTTQALGPSVSTDNEQGLTNGTFPVQENQTNQFSGFGSSSFTPFDQQLAQAPMTENPFSLAQGSATTAGFGGNSFQSAFAGDSFSQFASNPFLQAPISQNPLQWNSQSEAAESQPQQQTQSFSFGTSSHAPYDNTIQPSQIPEVLSNSFGKASGEPLIQDLATTDGYDSTTPALSTSYMPSQAASKAISLLSSDGESEDEAEEDVNNNDTNTSVYDDVDVQQGQPSVNFAGGSMNWSMYANRYAALANDTEYESDDKVQQKPLAAETDSEAGCSEDNHPQRQPGSYQYDDGDDVSGDVEEDEQEGPPPNGHGYYEDEGSSVDRGDEEEDLGSEGSYDSEDEGSYDEDDGEDNNAGGPAGQLPRFGYPPPPPRPNPALQVVGNNVEEAIELSD
ncbi:unnamed protein product [Zymoseptoria tritici ST99CH_1E4]|uniref:SAC3/GANP/THP3 conserved domain-containing protein n=1 Tax=Zymoseptoria tritici ST99CH_1E4 TaxID=1276532 RepID=A0A2H1GU75_ZYMTR|nr:unnamed protein product [Zymoseptoria tritici ST99CH_1E4]